MSPKCPLIHILPNILTCTTDILCQSRANTACGLHVTATAWFPHVATSVCKTKEEQVEIMKYRNLWKRGSFRKRACLTEIPRIMEKWQKGKHGKDILKQPVTETSFTETHGRNLNLPKCRMFPHSTYFSDCLSLYILSFNLLLQSFHLFSSCRLKKPFLTWDKAETN